MERRTLSAELLDPRNGPSWDLAAGPGRVYLVASTPRTGSTLLCRALWDTGRAGAPSEYLNPMQLRDWEVRLGSTSSRLRHTLIRGPLLPAVGRGRWTEARLADHLARVRARRTGPNGWFGLKIHRHHFERWFPDERAERLLGEIRWIRVSRRDRVAQAVSWARAVQTGQWASWQRPWMKPRFSRSRLDARRAAIDADEAAWDRLLAGREVLHLSYEDLAADLRSAVERVLGHLGVDAAGIEVAPSLRRQADATSAAWVERLQRTNPR